MRLKLTLFIFIITNMLVFSLEKPFSNEHSELINQFSKLNHVENVLQIGISEYTGSLAKKYDSVVVYGIRINKEQEERFNKFVKKFSHIDNLHPKNLLIPVKAVRAHNLALQGVNPNYDPLFSKSLNKIKSNYIGIRMFDLALISADNNIKGDLVNMLFNCVDIIVATDTKLNAVKYGWIRVKKPENYTRFHFSLGTGLTFWVNNSQSNAIQLLKKMTRG